jgi:hypothetical protein
MTTTSYDADTLYALLPATIRARDLEGGQPLYGLLAIIAEQINVLEDNLAQSYADLFIETCADWVVPYIGDLVGTTPLFDSSRVSVDTSAPVYEGLTGPSFVMTEMLRSRADVGRTIQYRRTKATRPMLEGMAFDVTGWPVFAAEMFQRLRWTQCVRNHQRPMSFGTPDLRDPNALDCLDGPFDPTTHGIDVRTPTSSLGWYQVPNVAFFLWRLTSFPLYDVPARPVSGAGDWRYHFSPLGNPAPLFGQFPPPPVAVHGWTPGSTSPPSEWLLPAPVRRMALAADLRSYDQIYGSVPPAQRPGYTAYYGPVGAGLTNPTSATAAAIEPAPGASTASAAAAFTIVCDGVTVPPEQLVTLYLQNWCQPPGNVVGVDPVRGRIALGKQYPLPKAVDVYFHQGFSAPIGGGQYARDGFLVPVPSSQPPTFVVNSTGANGSSTTVGAALTAWVAAGRPAAVITIVDNRSYVETLAISLPPGGNLTIEAADGARPHIQLSVPITITGDDEGIVTLSGLLVEGAINVTGPLGTLRLLHTTLVPGTALTSEGAPATNQPSIVVAGTFGTSVINKSLTVCMSSSITGPLAIPATIVSLYCADSIVDGFRNTAIGPNPTQTSGPPTTIVRSTVFGAVNVLQLVSASETIFTGQVTVAQRQVGCCRFSYVPQGSSAPRRYRCQPDLEISTEIAAAQAAQQLPLTPAQSNGIRAAVSAWLVPAFVSTSYGQAGYAQLAASGPNQISAGAEDGSEMGVFSQLKQPQRAQNLVTRLGEYLPLGLNGVLVYVT